MPNPDFEVSRTRGGVPIPEIFKGHVDIVHRDMV